MYRIRNRTQQFQWLESVSFQSSNQRQRQPVSILGQNQILCVIRAMKLGTQMNLSHKRVSPLMFIPPKTPYVSISIFTDVLNVLSTNATQDIILPAMQTARHPYRFANADTIGPALRYMPLSKLPTHATLPLPSPKYVTNSPKNTPNVYAMPSTIMLHINEAKTMTQP